MFSSGKQTNSCGMPSSFLSEPHNRTFEQGRSSHSCTGCGKRQNFCRFVREFPGFRAGRRSAQPEKPVYKLVQTGDNSGKCAQACKRGAGLCLPTGHTLHFASPCGAGPALVKLPNRPDIFQGNFPPDCSILLMVYAIMKGRVSGSGKRRPACFSAVTCFSRLRPEC